MHSTSEHCHRYNVQSPYLLTPPTPPSSNRSTLAILLQMVLIRKREVNKNKGEGGSGEFMKGMLGVGGGQQTCTSICQHFLVLVHYLFDLKTNGKVSAHIRKKFDA